MESTLQKVQNLLVFRLGGVNRILFHHGNKLFSKSGFPIEMAQLPVLMTLYYHGAQSQQEIASQIGRDKASINRTVGCFVKDKIAEVNPDASDKRKSVVTLTEEGKRLSKLVENQIIASEDRIFACLTETEKQTLSTLLAKVQDCNPIK